VLKKFEFQVEENFHRKRLDEFLFDKFSSLSKMYLRNVMNKRECEVNGYRANSGTRIKRNDFIEIVVDTKRETAMQPQQMPLDIVFEDAHILIVNKPSGLLVHPTHREKNGTLLNGLAYYLNNENPSETIRPGLVHRLDKQTSGLLVTTKTQKALQILTNNFKRKLVEKRYFALVEGVVKNDVGKIEARIGRYFEEKYWDVKEDGKNAETRFWVKERFSDKTLLELEPVTGRTNQLRIHTAHIGHPIIGDIKFGGREYSRLCLQAYKLAFHHPFSKEWVEFEINLPDELNINSK
jgi:23S rRNA pseudouridine1911/1915/1917 synthase